MTLGRLAGHTTDLFRLMALTLTLSEIDMSVAWQAYTMVSKGELLTRFKQDAAGALAAFKQTSDAAFHESWTIKRGSNILFSGDSFHLLSQSRNQTDCSSLGTATTWNVWPLCRRYLDRLIAAAAARWAQNCPGSQSKRYLGSVFRR